MSLTKLSLAGNDIPNPSPRKVWLKIIQESRKFFFTVYWLLFITDTHCQSGGSKIETFLKRWHFMLSRTIYAFVIQQYYLMVCVDYSHICYDPKVSLLLAVIANSLADDGKGL